MPSVGLKVVNPSLTLTRFDHGDKGWRLSYDASLANGWHQSVELTTDHKFEDLEGTVGFETLEGEAFHGFEHGSLSFWKEYDDNGSLRPASYLATIRLTPEDHARLLQSIDGGLPLMSINLDVPDMTYGWEPDGSGKKWDNAAKPAIEIKGYRLFFGKPVEHEVAPDLPELPVEADIKTVAALREVKRSIQWVLYALVALILVVLWKR